MKKSDAMHDTIKETIHAYTGTTCDFSFSADPAIEGVYAVQADLGNVKAQFLLTRSPRTSYDVKEFDFEVEEVEFTRWPPVIRK